MEDSGNIVITGAANTTHTGLPVAARQIRARFDADSIRVYQAYSHAIADSALAMGQFVSPPFSMNRMTWIKPSFLWMMYRAGWGRKDEGQQRILAIDIHRTGFDWALEHAQLAREQRNEPSVIVQWDPEPDWAFTPLPYRSLQMGLRDEAVRRYVNEWIVRIEDITTLAQEIKHCYSTGDWDQAIRLLPREYAYPVPPDVHERLRMEVFQ